MDIKNILPHVPLRISLTDYCNLSCFFCSNEGMPLVQKNISHANLDDLLYLISLLEDNGLQKISLTGGEPTVYKHLDPLLDELNQYEKINNKAFHTNGIKLSENLIFNKLSNFSKIAVSLHSLDFQVWKRMTNGNKRQFEELQVNLKYLSELKKRNPWISLELKIVPIVGYNDDAETLKQLLEFCSESSFTLKILNFEPIASEHLLFRREISHYKTILKKIGVTDILRDKEFRGQVDYLPIDRYKYKNTTGVIIEIGCGDVGVCEACYVSNEIFITPNLDIKPCHIGSELISLKEFVQEKNETAILKALTLSRAYLRTKPGAGFKYWGNA